MNPAPLRARSGILDGFQLIAAGKRGVADVGHADRYRHARERVAEYERVAADGRYARRDGDFRQAVAGAERLITDAPERCRERDRGEAAAPFERLIADGRRAGVDFDGSDLRLVIVPGRVVVLVIVHRPGALDGEQACVLMQRPGQTVAAFAGEFLIADRGGGKSRVAR